MSVDSMLVTMKSCEHTYEAKFRFHQYHHHYHLKILQSIWINLYHTRNLGWKNEYFSFLKNEILCGSCLQGPYNLATAPGKQCKIITFGADNVS